MKIRLYQLKKPHHSLSILKTNSKHTFISISIKNSEHQQNQRHQRSNKPINYPTTNDYKRLHSFTNDSKRLPTD